MFRRLAVSAAPSRLSSRQHPVVRAFRRARTEPGDDVVLDGIHLLSEALASGVTVHTVLTSRAFADRATAGEAAVIRSAAARGARVFDGTESVVAAASPVRSSSGVVALGRWTPAPIDAVLTPAPAIVLGLVDVQDPGNAGAAIRSADALSATGVLALDGTAHPGGWKALRGAMGSTFHLPVARATTPAALPVLRAAGLRIIATEAEGAAPLDEIDLTGPVCVLVGNEGAGLGHATLDAADERTTVRMQRGVNSLNVAVTAALILYEARRQRS